MQGELCWNQLILVMLCTLTNPVDMLLHISDHPVFCIAKNWKDCKQMLWFPMMKVQSISCAVFQGEYQCHKTYQASASSNGDAI